MSELELLVKIRENASRKKRTLLLPESHDDRVLKAAEIITRDGIGNVITLGNEETIRAKATSLGEIGRASCRERVSSPV